MINSIKFLFTNPAVSMQIKLSKQIKISKITNKKINKFAASKKCEKTRKEPGRKSMAQSLHALAMIGAKFHSSSEIVGEWQTRKEMILKKSSMNSIKL